MNPPLASLVDRWKPELLPGAPGRVVVPPHLRAYVLAGYAATGNGPILAVVPGERTAEELADDVRLFVPHVAQLPAWETLPFEHVSPNIATMAARSEARHWLSNGLPGIVVGSVRAVTQRISPSSVLPIRATPGAEYPFEALVRDLAAAGYHRTDRVESRGEFAVRGGIIDVFPAQGIVPVRVDFWGDSVDTVKTFAVGTQRSAGDLDELVAYPAREFRPDELVRSRAAELRETEQWATETWDRIAEGVMFQGIESWLPWLSDARSVVDEISADTTVVVFDPVRASARNSELIDEEQALAEALAETWGHGAPEAGEHPELYIGWDRTVEGTDVIEAPGQPAFPGDGGFEARGLDAKPGDAESVAEALIGLGRRKIDVVVAMDGEAAADRVARLLAEQGCVLARLDVIPEGSGVIAEGIHHGFVMTQLGVAVLGEQEIAGRRRSHRRTSARHRVGVESSAYRDLAEGDYIVHLHHGIGRFEGLVHRTMAGVERDYLYIAYGGDDKLYVPTDQLGAITRYSGGEAPRLSRLGGSDWAATRARVRKEVAVVAEEVIDLHRKRAASPGFRFSPDTPWQQEFEAAFEFEETPDQLTAIADVKADMETDRPMDRLIFGDVGFGKTEVALRAVFKAVQDGRQAAVLVPTTLLAQQHFSTFEERFRPFPIRVESLSRFLTARQQREVIKGLAGGEVDVVIGTHRLLSGDVEFKNLGLMVVDEEQRFGVAAKDKLKAIRTSVDVMTLTATPIPRTLEMALTGIREVSHIQTPPEDRHPILTFVGPYDERTVAAAIRRELLREGQVFYVHNRIQSIDHAVAKLRSMVPDARYAVAHGRMSEGQLEQVMFDFWNREFDVLVATTIIESGLDLPQVNTLIVERAERLGLAQLYQLRGRVGRGNQRAYAYLLHPEEQTLSEDAYRRLEAIGEFSDLGSGFQLAMRDLEIRGAGSIVSSTQSGHIAAVGFDLYVELVADAVNELSGNLTEEKEPTQVRIDLPLDAHLPADYIDHQAPRLEAYRRLAAASTLAEVDDVAAEWVDRYGPLPTQAAALIDVARLRIEALRVGIAEIVKARNEVRLSPVSLKASEEVRVRRLQPRALLRSGVMFVPAPKQDPVVAMTEFLRTMWPPDQE